MAEIAGRHHVAGLADHRIAGVVVGQAEHQAGPPHRLDQVEGILQAVGHRLVADDGDAAIEEGTRDGVMAVVRGDDADGIDAVGPRRLRRRHRPIVGIGAIRRDHQIGSRFPGPLRIGGQGAGGELPAVIHPGAQPMDRADEGAAAAADHSQPQPAAAALAVARARDHRSPPLPVGVAVPQAMPSMRRLAPWSDVSTKSSNHFSVTRMMWSAMNCAPSRAPSSGCLMQHSHSSTAQPG